MESTSVDVYVAAFRARCDAARRPGQATVDTPGLHGLLPSSDAPRIRLLVTDDRACDVLSAQLADARAGMIDVFAAAERCAGLLDGLPGWRSEMVTAMVCRDLQTVPALSLPGELTIRPVRRLAEDSPGGVALEEAVTAAALADPTVTDPRALSDYLRSLPPAMRLFVAVDSDGIVRATAGAGAFGPEASVIFINTDPDWRGRGVGRAMTAGALHAAAQSGARRAGLDATNAGLSIYVRLGFEVVTRTTRFLRAGGQRLALSQDARSHWRPERGIGCRQASRSGGALSAPAAPA
jgi:ribosomal protein S18 acetylase RimI-like enzyme